MTKQTKAGDASESASTASEATAQIWKELDKYGDTDAKLGFLVQRLADSQAKAGLAEHLRQQNGLLIKKTEQATLLVVKTDEAKSKLEELCRKLQQSNKEFREKAEERIKKLEAERHHNVDALKNSLADIGRCMEESRARSDAVATENARLAEQLKDITSKYEDRIKDISEHYQTRGDYQEKLETARAAELEMYKAKVEQLQLQLQKLQLEHATAVKAAHLAGAMETESQLRAQVESSSAKYGQLLQSIEKSNSTFDKFKQRIDQITKKLASVEGDAKKWKEKYEQQTKDVLLLSVEKKELEETFAKKEKQLAQLEQLCRRLRADQESPAGATTASQDAVDKEKSPPVSAE